MNFHAPTRNKTTPLARQRAWIWFFIAATCSSTLLAGSLAAKPPESTLASPEAAWSRFHGPQGLGAAPTGQLPLSWTANDYAWTVQLGEYNVGSPVANESTVFLLDSQPAEASDRSDSSTGKASGSPASIDLLAVDLVSGKEKWRQSHRVVPRKRHARNSPASSTPVIHGQQVFFAYGDAEGAYLYAYSLEGKLLWQRQLGPWSGAHGFGASPTVLGEQLILFNSQQIDDLEADQVAGENQMMAFDLATGSDLWRTPLKATRPCYGVPALYIPTSDDAPALADRTPQRQARAQIIGANKGNGLFGLDLTTGKMLWSLDVFNQRCCSSPLVIGDLAVGTCGSGGGGNTLSAVRIPSQPGGVPEEVFRITSGAPYVPTAAVKDGLIFTISDAGIASCFDTQDEGRKLWSQRIGGNFGASPIIVADQLLLLGLDGSAHLTQASRQRSPISQFDLGGKVGATPAYSSNRLILRVGSQLHCLLTHPE